MSISAALCMWRLGEEGGVEEGGGALPIPAVLYVQISRGGRGDLKRDNVCGGVRGCLANTSCAVDVLT